LIGEENSSDRIMLGYTFCSSYSLGIFFTT